MSYMEQAGEAEEKGSAIFNPDNCITKLSTVFIIVPCSINLHPKDAHGFQAIPGLGSCFAVLAPFYFF